MKNVFLVLCLLPFSSVAQLSENFDDGDFTNNPVWAGDVGSWQVLSGQLNSNHLIASSSFYLSTPSVQATNAQWEIWVNFKQATSGANYMDIYLTSDIQDLNATGNGYFVRIGGTTDEISLYKKTTGTATEIIDGTDLRSQVNSSDNYFKIRVTCTAASLWTLLDDNLGGNNFFAEGSVTDASFTTSAYFGISVTQSINTFFNKHFFDSISVGNIVVDITPPSVSSITNITQNTIDVIFSEAVDQATAETETNYSVNNGLGNPNSATLISANTVQLAFASNFANGILNTLSVLNVEDVNSNAITTASTGQFTYFAPVVPAKYDVVINEIIPDPDPQIGLPAVEFIEIYNRSNKTFDLLNWKFSDTGTPQNIPSFILTPDSYVILCDDGNATLFSSFGNVLGLSSFPSLNNDGDALKLYDSNSNIIDEINYDATFYNDPLRDDGGYSIERIDPDFTCANYLNWKASVNSNGGTPGTINSVDGIFSDTQSPLLLRALVTGTNSVKVFFDEPMNEQILSAVNTYSSDNGLGNPLSASATSDFTSATLNFSAAIQTGIIYTLSVLSSISDCAGNLLSGNNTVRFAIADTAINASDILLNEVLFNPIGDGASFVEIYNRSNKIFDLADFKIANLIEGTDTINYIYPVSVEGFLFFPGEYLAITEKPVVVKSQYETTNPSGFVTTDGIETVLYTDEGTVLLTDNNFNVVDQFYYSEDFHFPLLNDNEGVSLERISFNRPTQDSSNWHSAAETVGFATPAYENSQHAETIDDGSDFSVAPEIFSPDNDGHNDVVNFAYTFSEPGYTANLKIFDSKGVEIIHLVKNALTGLEGVFSWDGITEENLKSPTGIYIAWFEVFKTDGKVKKFKNPFVLATRL